LPEFEILFKEFMDSTAIPFINGILSEIDQKEGEHEEFAHFNVMKYNN